MLVFFLSMGGEKTGVATCSLMARAGNGDGEAMEANSVQKTSSNRESFQLMKVTESKI